MKNRPAFKVLLFSKAFFLLFISAQAHSAETANVDCNPSQNSVSVTDNYGCNNDAKTPLANISGSVVEVYEYDALGRLVKVKVNSALKGDYGYDKAGNRTVVAQQQ